MVGSPIPLADEPCARFYGPVLGATSPGAIDQTRAINRKSFFDLALQTTKYLFLDVVSSRQFQQPAAAALWRGHPETLSPALCEFLSIKTCETNNGFYHISLWSCPYFAERLDF
jgi:hypothetical protein